MSVSKQKQIEKLILNEFSKENIRLEKLLKKRKEPIDEFLVNFFTKNNNDKKTIFVKSKEVYTDVKKRRSLGDIYMLCKYYYPDTTLKEVVDLLYKILPERIPRFRSSMCNMIKKRVFYQGSLDQSSHFYNHSTPDEFNMTIEQWLKI